MTTEQFLCLTCKKKRPIVLHVRFGICADCHNEANARRRARELILRELYGGLWHTTHPDRFANILADGAISPEPNIPDVDRWKTSGGPELYPFVRTLGGVSLFDFGRFDIEEYTRAYPLSSWHAFVPFLESWGRSVWIEIDRGQVESRFISGPDLVAKWDLEKAWRHSIMPRIEAAHLGPLPRAAFKRAFLVCGEDNLFHPIGC